MWHKSQKAWMTDMYRNKTEFKKKTETERCVLNITCHRIPKYFKSSNEKHP